MPGQVEEIIDRRAENAMFATRQEEEVGIPGWDEVRIVDD